MAWLRMGQSIGRRIISFGGSERSKTPINDSPGPGAYKIPVKIQNEPSYLLPNKSEEFKYV